MIRAPTLPQLAALLAVFISVTVFLVAAGNQPTANAATAPGLGSAASFAVLGGQSVTNTGATTVFGNVGVSPGSSITGFPPGIVAGGAIHQTDALALQAQSDVTTAYNALAAQPCIGDLTGQDLGGLTLTEGAYCFSSSAQLTGPLVLDAQGNAAAVFVFQIGSTLTTASASSVNVINGGTDCNVYWQVGSSATLGTGTQFVGNILALASISMTTGADLHGRALARNGSVTLDTNDISILGCVSAATPTPTATPATPTPTGTPPTPSPTAVPPTPTPTVTPPTPTPTATPVIPTPTDTPGVPAPADTPGVPATAPPVLSPPDTMPIFPPGDSTPLDTAPVTLLPAAGGAPLDSDGGVSRALVLAGCIIVSLGALGLSTKLRRHQ